MDKFKLLLAGKNKSMIDDFFNHMQDSFDILTTSLRYDDMSLHVDCFEPHFFVLCLSGETRDDIARFSELKRKLEKREVIFAAAGDKEDIETFQKNSFNMAELELSKPITVEMIKDELLNLYREKERIKEEERQRELQAKAEAAAKARKHVLIIDDDPMMLKLIKEQLHDGYDVATAISGKIAYKFLENKSTNLILLDYEMPVESGPEVFEKLRAMPSLEEVPILFLTGVTEREKIKKVLALKPQGYLLKPVDREKLLEALEKFIGAGVLLEV